MNKKRKFTVKDAYAISTPADSVRLYGDWADSYDTGFVKDTGYILHLGVAELFLKQQPLINGTVLDVGCGTGLVGVRLRQGGIELIDGIDISPQMLAVSGKKKTDDGLPIYRNLITADLTKKLDIPDNQYAGLISAGTFTQGHLGPDALDELWRVTAPGTQCTIGIKTTHFETMSFDKKLSADVANGKITKPELIERNIYSAETDNLEHASDTVLVVICQIM